MVSMALAENLFTWPSAEPCLIGSRCRSCATTVFPVATSCARCSGPDMEERLLPRRGKLWTWTVQNFRPKSPYAADDEGSFVPYGVGYVDLDGEVLVESRLTESDPERLAIGDDVELTIVPFRHTPDGDEVMTFAFRPIGSPED